jgi:hypothetical protein
MQKLRLVGARGMACPYWTPLGSQPPLSYFTDRRRRSIADLFQRLVAGYGGYLMRRASGLG